MYNASLNDKNLQNLLSKMEKFNDSLREKQSLVNLRYQQVEIETSNLKEKVQELEEIN